jgi:hypothetical protein
MQPRNRRHASPKTAAAAPPAEPEPSLEQLRAELTLKVIRLAGQYQWPACPRRICRRRRACVPAGLQCANPRPAPQITEEERSASMAHFRRALLRRQAELEAEAK